MAQPIISIPDAIEVFVHGFSYGKSRTYPYKPRKVGPLWVMRDDPPRKKERKIEIISHGVAPENAIETIKEAGIGWHFLCEIHHPEDDFQAIRDQYKALGYKALSTEWLFVHDLQDIQIHESTPPVRLVTDDEAMQEISRLRLKSRKLMPGTRQFATWDTTNYFGRVTSIPYNDSAWVADLYVEAQHRGKGYGRALMSRLLQTDREHGIKQSVLLASTDGARLYPHLGYEQIGVLQMFCPSKRT